MSATPLGSGVSRCLLLSAHHWESPVHLSAHHLATFIASNGADIAFLSTPTSFLHRLRYDRNSVHRARFEAWRRGGGRALDGQLFHYTPLALLPPSRLPVLQAAALFRHWPHLTLPPVERVLAREGFGAPDLMIADTALGEPLWRLLGKPRLIYRVTDRNASYPGAPAHLIESERRLAAEAETVVATGDQLMAYAEQLAPGRVIEIGNGVDLEHFGRSQPLPADLQTIPSPRALYVGTIAAWFDWALLCKSAEQTPDVSYVIIGPEETHDRPGALPSNVHVLGPRAYADVPGYMQASAVGLIPFRRDGLERFVDTINPIKLYEYFAAGLPVVATPFRQLEVLRSPARLASAPGDFAAAVSALASRPPSGAEEKAFAERFGWERQFADLAPALGFNAAESQVPRRDQRNSDKRVPT